MKQRRPDIGIMAFRSSSLECPFGESGYFKKLMAVAGRLKCLAVTFSPEDVDWERGRIKGFTWNGREWRLGYYGFPRVVYDRVFHPAPKGAGAKLARLRRVRGIIFLNRSPSGKWEVYSHLIKIPEAAKYLPQTRRYLSPDGVVEMLRVFGTVFLKPDFGTHGKGILRVKRVAPGEYRVDGRDGHNRIYRQTAKGRAALGEIIGRWVRKKRFLIQQGLSLVGPGGRAFDLRVLVQKNSLGQWEVTGSAVRVGPSGSVTSNLHGGGDAEDTSAYLARVFGPAKSQEIIQEIGIMAVEVCRAMEAAGTFMEFGLDAGVDTQGRVWLIEVNSKPGRRVFSRTGDLEARWESIRRPIEYAAFVLAEKRRKGPPHGNPTT